MALQYSVAVNNGRLDSIETTIGTSPTLEIRTGAVPANCAAASTGTVLATLALPADWMNAAASGVKTKLGTWQDASADATGNPAAHFRIFQGATCHMQGTYGTSGTDMIGDSVSFTAGQSFTITAFSQTAANT